MKPRVLFFQVLPSVAAIIFWFSLTVLGDWILHARELQFVGRYLGPIGVSFVGLSFIYSARKRKWFKAGTVKFWLKIHESLAWTGSLLILVHSGIHFNALLPWLASIGMIIAVISGVMGQYILKEAQAFLKNKKQDLKNVGDTETSIERELFLDALVVDKMKRWRSVHKPITAFVAVSILFHIIAIYWFGGLK